MLVITAFMAYVVPDLWAESTKAGSKISENFTPENAARQRAYLKRYSPALEKVAGDKIEKFLSDPNAFYNENMPAETTTTVDADGKLTATTGGGGSVIISTLISSLDLLLVPFFVFYILIDFQKWREALEDLIPPRFREPFSRLFDESGRILESYVRGQLLIGAIMAVFYAVGFWFLGVPAWAGIALIAGLLNAVPSVGTILGIVLAGGFTVAGGGNFWDIAAVLGVFVGVQTLERLCADSENIGRAAQSASDGGSFRFAYRRKALRSARRNSRNSGNRHRQSLFQIPARALSGFAFLPRRRPSPG